MIKGENVILAQKSIPNSNNNENVIVITKDQNIDGSNQIIIKEDQIKMNEEIRGRMKDFVGMNNLSLFLRNSEHIVNYILFGKWECKDITINDNNVFFNGYKVYLDDITKLKLDSLPYLMVKERFNKNLESDDKSFSFLETVYKPLELKLDIDGNDIENSKIVLVVGSEGSGKTTLINTLLNKSLFNTSLSDKDKSSDIYFVKSEANENGKKQEIIFIDTFGFFTDDKDIKDLCKELESRVKDILKIIHLLIIVIKADRILHNLEINMKKFLNESGYKDKSKKFLFIITNSINSELKEKETLKEDIKNIFELRKEEDGFSSFLFFNHMIEENLNDTTRTIFQNEIKTIQDYILNNT